MHGAWDAVWAWLGYWSGVADEAGKGYAFWSGIGSCLAYLGVLAGAWHHLNCHEKGCKRIGSRTVSIEGCAYKVCGRHHPHDGTGQVAARYHRARPVTTDSGDGAAQGG